MIEHCVSTFNAIQKEECYRAYTAEIFRGIANQLGFKVKMSYFEMIDSLKPQETAEETRDASEVIDAIKSKAEYIRGN